MLADLTGANLSEPDPAGMVSALEAAGDRELDALEDPTRILEAAERTLSDESVDRTPRQSASFSAALDNVANARSLEPLTDSERERVDAVPEPIGEALAPLVDALAFASRQRGEAFSTLTAGEQRELLTLASRLAPGSQAEITSEDVQRFDGLSSEVETGRLLKAGNVLLGAVLDAREDLEFIVEEPAVEDSVERAVQQAAELEVAQSEAIRSPDGTAASTRTNHGLLHLASDILDARTSRHSDDANPTGAQPGSTASATAESTASSSLSEAVLGLAEGQFPATDALLDERAREQIDAFPSPVEAALTDVVDAYTDAASGSVPSSEAARNVLTAVADNVDTLELWSLVLTLTPPDARVDDPGELAERRAGLALATSATTREIPTAVQLAAHHAGVPTPAQTPEIQSPPIEEALAAWEEAFAVERTAGEEDGIHETVETMPTQATEALATLLWAQAEAQRMLDDLALTADERDELERASKTLAQTLTSGTEAMDSYSLEALEQVLGLTSDQVETGGKVGLLLAAATARANELLDVPGSDDDPRTGARETVPDDPPRNPGTPSPEAPEPPSSGEEPSGPYADSDRDVWFEDPSGLLLVTGEGSTTYPDRFLALSLDLGGDDVRPDNAGGVTRDAQLPFAVSLDAGGNDEYVSRVPFAQGGVTAESPLFEEVPESGFPVGILADYEGDDTYEVQGLGQGASYGGGMGLLYDADGDDTYGVVGTVTRSPYSFEVAGGQGYAFKDAQRPGVPSPPALGFHVDALGNDTFQAHHGQGAGISLSKPELTLTNAQTASGLLFDTEGTDEHACEEACLGQGRLGSMGGLECDTAHSQRCSDAFLDDARDRGGFSVATGTFVDTDGRDEYRDRGDLNDQVGPASIGLHRSMESFVVEGLLPDGLRVNQSTRIDVSLSDSDGDFVPDLVADSLGYNADAEGGGPVDAALDGLDPKGLAVGRDDDGDGFSNALEDRLGTDPQDPDSAPVAPPTASTSNGADKLLDVRLDLTTGTILTRDQVLEGRSPVSWIGLWPHASNGDERHLRVDTHNDLWDVEGLDTDGLRVALLGVGDTVATRWNQDYLLTVDPGGADTYENNAGAASQAIVDREGTQETEQTVPGLAIDVSGSDTYVQNESVASQGTGAYQTFGLLVDLVGDDGYEAKQAAQGSAVGVNATGVLVDAGGDDVYEAEARAQGFAGAECGEALAAIGDEGCADEGKACDSPQQTDTCRAMHSSSRALSLLLDARGDDAYTSDGQGVLQPNELRPEDRLCYLCPMRADAPQLTVLTPPEPTPEPGPYDGPPSSSNYPAPLHRGLDPTGDAATFLDLEGEDTYAVRGFREPVESQGYARGEGVPGQGSAAFLDLAGRDDYRQLPPPSTVADPRIVEKDNHVYLNGVPATEEAPRLVSLFLDTAREPDRVDEDRNGLPDVVDAWLGAEPVDRRNLETDPRNVDERNPVESGWMPGVNGSRLLHSDNVLDLPRLGVTVSGFEDTVHEEGGDALIVDLGGDDIYEGRVGAGVGDAYDPRRTIADVGVLLDLDGDDTYETHVEDPGDPTRRPFLGATQGSGVLGVGVHVDGTGRDTYNVSVETSARSQANGIGLSQGAAFQGVGVLVGSKQATYRVAMNTTAPLEVDNVQLGLSQGAAWSGLGLLFTQPDPTVSGTTVYNVSAEPPSAPRAGAQGFAIQGAGLLVDPDPSESRFEATAAAQGAALPHRLASPVRFTLDFVTSNPLTTSREGGLGLVVAGQGTDDFRARSLAQGAAIGARPHVGTGSAWIGALVDPGGDDRYRLQPGNGSVAPALGQGAGAAGGAGLLVDRSGNDDYRAGANRANRSVAQGAAATVEGPYTISCIYGCPPRGSGDTLGVLADLDGHDAYRTNGSLAHGSSLTARPHEIEGIAEVTLIVPHAKAILYDADGDDAYSAPHAPGLGAGAALVEDPVEQGGVDGGGGGGDDPAETVRNECNGVDGFVEAWLGDTAPKCMDAWSEIEPLIPSVPSPEAGVVLHPHWTGTGVFLDAAGADGYDPLPRPDAVEFDPGGFAREAAGDGLGNNEAWTDAVNETAPGNKPLATAGVGVDAPSRGAARRALTDAAMEAAGLSNAAVESSVRSFDETDGCGPPIGSGPVNGTLCLEANVSLPRDADVRVEEVRFYAISNRSGPTLVDAIHGARASTEYEEGPGEGTVVRTYATDWDSRPAAFPDGPTRVRTKVTLSSGGVGHYGPWQRLSLEDQQRIELDNPPWVTVEAPAWVNPGIDETVNLTVKAAGENGTANATIAIGPCEGGVVNESLTEKPVDPGSPAVWHLADVSLEGCPTRESALAGRTGNVTVFGHAIDGNGNAGPVQSTKIGVDRRSPSVELTVPSAVNETVGRSGAFRVAWNVTETLGDVPFGRVNTVDVAVGVDGGPVQTWQPNAPHQGQARWEGFQHGGRVTVEVRAEDEAGNERVNRETIPVDLRKPRLQDPSVDPRYVQSGQPAAFTIQARDDGGISGVFVEVAGERHRLSSGEDGWVFYGFGAVTERLSDELGSADASRPEGYPFRFVVEDRVGNRATTIEQQVFLDDVDPEIHEARVDYPGGTAAGPGDLLTLVVHATDAVAVEGPLHADVSNVSSAEQVPLRLDKATGNFTGTFVLDRDPAAANATIHVVAEDEAGNREEASPPVRVATQAPTVSGFTVEDREANTATIGWRTDVPSTARLLATDKRSDETRTFPVHATGREHEVELDGLSPNTAYEVRLVPLNEAGDGGQARSLTLTTRTAIDVGVSQPDVESVHAGTLPVAWNATDPTGEPVSASLSLRSSDAEIPIQRPLASTTRPQGELQAIGLDTASVADGIWDLVIEAERGHDRTVHTVPRLVVDNTAPIVRITSPPPGSALAPGDHELQIAAVDRLAGVDEESVRVHVADETVRAEPIGENAFAATITIPPSDVPEVAITAGDEAGNLARESVPFFVRGELDPAAALTIDLPGDQQAAKPGDEVRVRWQAGGDDTAGGAVLSPSPATGEEAVPFRPASGGLVASFTVAPETPSGVANLTVALEERENAPVHASVPLPVDAADPRVRQAEATMMTESFALLRACANEPVKLRVLAQAPGAQSARADGDDASPCHTLRVDGLAPGVEYNASLTAVDGAGNEATTGTNLTTRPDEQPPLPPGNLETRVPTDRIVRLAWTEGRDDVGVKGYEVRRSPADADDWRTVGTTDETTFVDDTAEPGLAYAYEVRTLDLAGTPSPVAARAELTAYGSPSLSGASVSPERASHDQLFTFTVNYTGPLTDETRVTVEVDGTPHAMEPESDPDTCWDGCTFRYETELVAERLGGEPHTYRFSATANGFTATEPTAGSEQGPIVTAGQASGFGGGLGLAAVVTGVTGAIGGVLAVVRRIGGGLP